jgi:hypothetical protein
VLCPLCRQRKARRSCPALGHQICTVCCGTKRLTEIRCPSDCPYLASAREHPPAATIRQQQRDLESMIQLAQDFNDRQSQLFVLIATSLLRYEPPELHALLDADISEAARALASTFETSSRGVIYEHRPQSLPAERLVVALKPILIEAGQRGGSAFERDAAVVLTRIAEAAARSGEDKVGFLDMLRRVMRTDGPDHPQGEAADQPRLIVP